MVKDRLDNWLFSIGIGISVAIVLAAGHVLYGIQLMSLTNQNIAILDSYVFFLSYASLILIASMFYYFKQDVTSTVGIILSGIWALSSGFQDLIVYILLGYFENTYPWLANTTVGYTSYILNQPVTTLMIILNTTIFGIIFLGTSYYLFKYEDKVFGINI